MDKKMETRKKENDHTMEKQPDISTKIVCNTEEDG